MRQIAAAMMTAPIVAPPTQDTTDWPQRDEPAPERVPRRRRLWRRAASPSEAWKPTHAGG